MTNEQISKTEYARRECEILDRWHAGELNADQFLKALSELKKRR